MLKSILIELLGGYNKQQMLDIHNYYQETIHEKDKVIKKLQEKAKTYKLTPLLRGKRHDTIIFPESKEAFIEWLHTDLIPTLHKDGNIINKEFMEKIK